MTPRAYGLLFAAVLLTSIVPFAHARAATPDKPPAPMAALEPTLETRGAQAAAALEERWYRERGRWAACLPDRCGRIWRDWGADALTGALVLRARTTSDARALAILSELVTAARTYAPCRLGRCQEWSDIPLWDAVADTELFGLTRRPEALAKAEGAFAAVDASNAYARGACPEIRYQRPLGGQTGLKTLETDANYVRAAVALARLTHEPRYLRDALRSYAAIRARYYDPAAQLYTVYVFDDGITCRRVPHRFFASVNGAMIAAGIDLAELTHRRAFLRDAETTARRIAGGLDDANGVFADLQADNDVAEPLVLAMFRLAHDRHSELARRWIVRNAAALAPVDDGRYGRFFDGPAPGATTAWAASGSLALAVAAGAIAPHDPIASDHAWDDARYVRQTVDRVPSRIAFTGRAVALIGTLGAVCCEHGRVRLAIDGHEPLDRTGIWQNKSAANHAVPDSVLFVWRWRTTGRHVIALDPAVFNAKEGGTFVRLSGFRYVP